MPVPVCFTIDNLGDAADLQRGVIEKPRPSGANPPLDRGYPALLDLFGRYDIPLTCFVEGWSARQYPERLRHLQGLGHEIGMHGWQHEKWSQLADDAVVTLATRATESLTDVLGNKPRAFRAPGGPSTPFTRQVLATLGYDIDASHAEDAAATLDKSGLASIPYHWSGVDATHWLWNSRSSVEVENLWLLALSEAARQQQPFVFIWHPHVMGLNQDWLETGERIIRFIRRETRFSISSLRRLREQLLHRPAT